jgi:hypothetical protein
MNILERDLMVHAVLEINIGMIKADVWLFEQIRKRARAESAKGENNDNNIIKLEGRDGQDNA